MVDISERDARIIEMRRKGETAEAIATELGIGRRQIHREIHRIARLHDLPISVRNFWRPESLAPALEMMARGMSRQEIAAALGYSKSCLDANLLKAAGGQKRGRIDRTESATRRVKMSLEAANIDFVDALKEAGFSSGAGEKTDIRREPMGRFTPVEARSGVGSPALLCAGN